jgi:phage regulator Rha-like protein
MAITPLQGGDAVTMSSQEISELVGKRHDNVKRTIETLADRKIIQLPQIEEVKNHLGQAVEQYLFSGDKGKRDSLVVVAQLSPEFTGAMVDRWQNLEQQVQAPALPGDYISALEHLLESKRSEQLAIEQRDYAIETKAEIGSRREATAMATASAAVRQANQLKEGSDAACGRPRSPPWRRSASASSVSRVSAR